MTALNCTAFLEFVAGVHVNALTLALVLQSNKYISSDMAVVLHGGQFVDSELDNEGRLSS